MGSIISVQNVSVKYDSGFAVKDVSFDVCEGDYFCIVGENGSGKSTLMNTVLGLIRPSGGRVAYNGLKQNQIGFIPQQTAVQKDFPTSVREVILSGCTNRRGVLPFHANKDRQRVRDNIKRLDIEPLARKSYCDLSGGQQQRVLLARALCSADKILLLDEPAGGLDPVMANELYGLLGELNNSGAAIVMISHDMASAVKYAGKILHMQTSPLFYGKKKDYLASPVYKKIVGGAADA
ncbi:MAG: metal ABC transporter ATP-binding protein [Oscillospiraceae bacterium]|nr:metal ABC transporter ATP-binding protein [Oscillospiraceae bacterium]